MVWRVFLNLGCFVFPCLNHYLSLCLPFWRVRREVAVYTIYRKVFVFKGTGSRDRSHIFGQKITIPAVNKNFSWFSNFGYEIFAHLVKILGLHKIKRTFSLKALYFDRNFGLSQANLDKTTFCWDTLLLHAVSFPFRFLSFITNSEGDGEIKLRYRATCK